MKKVVLTVLLICFVGLSMPKAIAATTSTKTAYNKQIREAILKYKKKNYVGCIQDLVPVAQKDPSNVVVHYYIANSFMDLGAGDKAIIGFDKVISLNTIPILTSYAIQAKNCINTSETKCVYRKLTDDQIGQMIKNPAEFLSSLGNKGENASPDNLEIDRLIKGTYKTNIHPEANRVIIDTLLKQEKHDMNVSAEKYKSEAPTDEEIVKAIKVLAKAGINPIAQNQQPQTPYTSFNNQNEYAYITSMMGNNQNTQQNNNFMNMLPFLVQQQNGNKQINSEMMQAMMMSQMMPNFGFDTTKNK